LQTHGIVKARMYGISTTSDKCERNQNNLRKAKHTQSLSNVNPSHGGGTVDQSECETMSIPEKRFMRDRTSQSRHRRPDIVATLAITLERKGKIKTPTVKGY
jgi:hypothetical protein